MTQPDAAARHRLRLRVRGLVQGVGFRPHVWRLAMRRGLTGFALNDRDGVLIEVQREVGGAMEEASTIAMLTPMSRRYRQPGSSTPPMEACRLITM